MKNKRIEEVRYSYFKLKDTLGHYNFKTSEDYEYVIKGLFDELENAKYNANSEIKNDINYFIDELIDYLNNIKKEY